MACSIITDINHVVGLAHDNNEQVDDEPVGLLVHLLLVSYVGDMCCSASSTYHTKNLPFWTKPTPLTLASHWASLSLFILSSSALTHSLLVSALPAPVALHAPDLLLAVPGVPSAGVADGGGRLQPGKTQDSSCGQGLSAGSILSFRTAYCVILGN